MAAWLLLHLLAGAGGAWLARRYALRRGLVDQPGERRSHSIPTPRSGGIGIVAGVLAGGIFLVVHGAGGPLPSLALAGFAAVAVIGLIDDHRPLSPWLRLGVHAVAAGGLAVGVWATWSDPQLAVVAFLLALVLTNVWNFMDGIDGIATTQAILVAGTLAVSGAGSWQTQVAAGLVAACVGFLPFNFPKARLFLGDVGSGALGFLLATLLVAAMARTGAESGTAWLLLPSAFLTDAALTLAGRVRRREAWWRPHALHAYQSWARRAGSHVPVTMLYAVWTALACGLALAVREAATEVKLGVLLAWYTASAAIWWMLQHKGMQAVEDRE